MKKCLRCEGIGELLSGRVCPECCGLGEVDYRTRFRTLSAATATPPESDDLFDEGTRVVELFNNQQPTI